jgi:FixJ family two-component response regulator
MVNQKPVFIVKIAVNRTFGSLQVMSQPFEGKGIKTAFAQHSSRFLQELQAQSGTQGVLDVKMPGRRGRG